MSKGGKKNTNVEPMPSLVFNNLTAENTASTATKKRPPKNERSDAQQLLIKKISRQYKSKNWMILLVSSMAIIICALWGYSLLGHLSNFNFKKTDESKILENSKNSWDKIFTITENTQLERELTKIQLKNILSQALKTEKNSASNSVITIDSATGTQK